MCPYDGGNAGEIRLQAVYSLSGARFGLFSRSGFNDLRPIRPRAHDGILLHWRAAGFAGASPAKEHAHQQPTLHARRDGRPVILGKAHGRNRGPAPAFDPNHEEAYKLVGIEPVRTPEGCTGRDWHLYRIKQGENVITGYRQGDLRAATTEVERIVVGLNERRVASKGRPGPKPKASTRAATPAAAPEADDSASGAAQDG